MTATVIFIIHALVSIFAVMNPIGNVPIFVSLTDGYTKEERRVTAKKAVFVSFIILTVFLLLGNFIFQLFGITIDAFRVAGGILIFGIAYRLLHAKPSHMQHPVEAAQKQKNAQIPHEDVFVTPLATPLIAGPGTITAVMASASGSGLVLLRNSIGIFIAFTLVLIGTYIIFHYSSWIISHLRQTELNVITRLMGLILAVIAVQMAVAGVSGLFPGLLK